MYKTPDNLRLPDFCQYGENGVRGLPYVLKYGMCVERIRDDDPNGIQPFYGCNGGPGNGGGTNDPFRRSPWGGVCHVGYQSGAELAAKPSSGELIHVKPFALSIRVLALLGALAYGSLVHAQAVPATASGAVHPYSLGGNTYTFSGAQATAANASKFTYAVAANGSINTSNVASIPSVSGGPVVPITVNGAVTKAAAAAAVGRFALKAVGVIGVLQVGVGIYDLAKELGFTASTDSGALVVTKPDPSICTTAPCYSYEKNTIWGIIAGSTPEIACRAYTTRFQQAYPTAVVLYVSSTAANCNYSYNGAVTYSTWSTVRSVAAQPATQLPSSPAELEAAIAAKTSWPSTSAIARATKDAIKSGESLAVEPVSVTGPAAVSAGRVVTNNGTSTTTAQTFNNYNYAGNVITVTNNTTSTTVNNASGATEAATTTTETPVVEPEPEDPVDPCVENPDRLGCITGGTAETPSLRKENQAVTVDAVNFSTASGCPSPLSFTIPTGSYAISYQPLCDRLYILKALFVAMGAFIAAYVLADSFRVS